MSALRAERAEKDSLIRQHIQEMSDVMALLSHTIQDVEQEMRAQDVTFLKVRFPQEKHQQCGEARTYLLTSVFSATVATTMSVKASGDLRRVRVE